MKLELGQINSLRALETDTGAITGQKWPKMAKIDISSKISKLYGIFLKISLNLVKTRTKILIESFEY